MYESYFPQVVQAIPGPERLIYVYFSDGSIRQYDMAPLIAAGGVFSRLEEEAFFRDRLTVLNDTAAWDVSECFDPRTCIDIDPFTLYEGEAVRDPLEPAS